MSGQLVRVADYVVQYLAGRGVSTVFMLSGTGSIYLDEALATADNMTCVCARHEAAAALMATGSAKLTGQLGVAVVTSGPGATNALSGIVDAWTDAVPVLVLSGQVEHSQIDQQARSFGVQGLNVVECVRSLTKYAAVVDRPQDIRLHLDRALAAAFSGRAGPVWLDMPADVQAALIDPAQLVGHDARPPVDAADVVTDAAEELLILLRSARRPLLVVGQGVRQAGAQHALRAVVRQLRLPVVAARLGYDLLSYEDELFMGQGGIRGRRHTSVVMREADLVVSLGCSLSAAFAGVDCSAFAPDARIAVVDVDPGQLKRSGAHAGHLFAVDVLPVLTELLRRVPGESRLPDLDTWRRRCADLKAAHPTVTPDLATDPINSYHFVQRLEVHTGAGDVFVVDTGSAYYVSGQTLEFNAGQREVTSAALLNMGAAVPMGIGASFGAPTSRILVLVGDGALELNIQELATLAQYQRNVKVFVLNNGGYASMRESQDALCEGRKSLDEPDPLHFESVAKAFGLPYLRVDRTAQLDGDLAAILAGTGPALVEVVCDHQQQLMSPIRVDAARSHDGVPILTS